MMLAIDLGCCAGGASMGLSRAGFELLGVDIEPQPEYPFRFIQADALEFDFSAADFVWASPNCQPFSVGTAGIRKQGKVYPDWLPQIRQRLQQSGLPYIIENVPGAPLLNPIRLWGQQFGLSLVRCRLFESNLLLLAPPPPHPNQRNFSPWQAIRKAPCRNGRKPCKCRGFRRSANCLRPCRLPIPSVWVGKSYSI